MIAELLVEVDRLLSDWQVDHAFGGAIALNYYAEPRATTDIDVNVATSFDDAAELVEQLEQVGFELEQPLAELLPLAGARMRRGADVVDLFFSFDGFHQRLRARARRVPLRVGGTMAEIPILSSNDLVVVKISFNRGKDWVDIEAMVASGTPIDVDLVQEELVALRGPTMYPRVARLRQIIEERSGR